MQLRPATLVPSVMLRSSVVPTVVGEGAVLLDLNTKFFYHLNAGAWAIVQMLESSGASVESIVERSREAGCTEDQCDEIVALLARLQDFDLVEPADAEMPVAPTLPQPWISPRIERQAEPLHRLVTSAFDPSIPLAE